MVEIKEFGKLSEQETQLFASAANTAGQLSSGINKFNGVLEKDLFLIKINQAITAIDNLNSFKTTLLTIKSTLQNS